MSVKQDFKSLSLTLKAINIILTHISIDRVNEGTLYFVLAINLF